MSKVITAVGLFVAICQAPATAGGAQSVEVLFTPAVVQQAVSLKEALRVEQLTSSNAWSLVGVSAERKKAYSNRVATTTVVIILGEEALKAVADVDFSTTVIVVNSTGATAAKGRVIRVFDGASAPANAQAVSSASAVKGLLGTGKEVALKGPANTVIQGVLDALK